MDNQLVSLRNRELTPLQKYMVRRFHPRRIFIDMAALPWSIYFLWQHDWPLALAVAVVGGILGLVATADIDAERYSRTLMGKMAFLHLEPANVVVQLIGIAGAVWAIWAHSATGILGSLSVIFLGHLAGWDEALAQEVERPAERAA